MLTKEQLQLQLEHIKAEERRDMIAIHYPEYKKLEGKCFKVKNNYSCPKEPSDYWWAYTKITEIMPEDVYDTGHNGVTAHFRGFRFQTDMCGHISVENYNGYAHLTGKEISTAEFEKAWDKMLSTLNDFKKL